MMPRHEHDDLVLKVRAETLREAAEHLAAGGAPEWVPDRLVALAQTSERSRATNSRTRAIVPADLSNVAKAIRDFNRVMEAVAQDTRERMATFAAALKEAREARESQQP